MTRIVSIAPVEREAYKDIMIQGDQITEKDAPVLAFYEVELRGDSGQYHRFDAEIRTAPRGLQVDWYEDLDDFLFGLPTREEANRLREELSMGIYEAHYKDSDRRPLSDQETSTEQSAAGKPATRPESK